VYAARLDTSALSPRAFSARRVPDRMHFRFVRCRACGLVRSDPIAEPEQLAALYRAASFDYGDETAALRATYGRYLHKLAAMGVSNGHLLDVGCGNGFMLEEALKQGMPRSPGSSRGPLLLRQRLHASVRESSTTPFAQACSGRTPSRSLRSPEFRPPPRSSGGNG